MARTAAARDLSRDMIALVTFLEMSIIKDMRNLIKRG